jgi:hypothetical protein
MPLHGLAYFPGIQQIISASISFTHGITPSMATLEIAPQRNFTAQIGTLRFFDGQTTIEFKNCALDTNTFERDDRGFVWKLSVHDRRWKWTQSGGGGAQCGYQNLRKDDNTIIASTKTGLRDLVKACLDNMEEEGYDVSSIPNDVYPQVTWDFALPAQALASLCEEAGFYVVLGLDDRVRICKIGNGNNLPITPDVTHNSLALTIPTGPDEIRIVCGPDRFQADLELEAVGIEDDSRGTIKPIDQLTYKPAGGWSGKTTSFKEVLGNGSEAEIRRWNLAQQSVWKWYRIKLPITVPGYVDASGKKDASITEMWQLKLEDEQVATTNGKDEKERGNLPAVVYGEWFKGLDGSYNNTPSRHNDLQSSVESISWSLDKKNGVVKFSEPVYANDDDHIDLGELYPVSAILWLRTAFTLLDEKTGSPVRSYYKQRTGNNLGTMPRYEIINDLVVWHLPEYDHLYGDSIKKITDNWKDVQKECQVYWLQIAKQYQSYTPQTVHYNGLKRINLDGAIQHITLNVSDSGATTVVSRNNEQFRKVKSFNERRLTDKLKELLRDMQGQSGSKWKRWRHSTGH